MEKFFGSKSAHLFAQVFPPKIRPLMESPWNGCLPVTKRTLITCFCRLYNDFVCSHQCENNLAPQQANTHPITILNGSPYHHVSFERNSPPGVGFRVTKLERDWYQC